jgi:hypothetical protein
MSLSLDVGYTDSVLDPDTAQDFSMGKLNITEDLVVRSNTPGNCVIVNVTSPLDRVEKFRFGYQEVQDVYKGSGIDPTYYGNSRKGVSIVAQNTNTVRVLDSADSSNNVDLPLSCHIVIKVPNHALITPAVVYTMLGRLMAAMHDEAGADNTRLTSLLHGALVPTEL